MEFEPNLTPEQTVNFVRSLERLGSGPFDYFPPDRFYEYDQFTLKHFSHEDEFIEWDTLLDYCNDTEARIKRKCGPTEDPMYWREVYGKTPIPPVVLSSDGFPLDGHHRLTKYKEEQITDFLAYVGVKT